VGSAKYGHGEPVRDMNRTERLSVGATAGPPKEPNVNPAQVRSSPREAGRRARAGLGNRRREGFRGRNPAGDALLLELLPPVFVLVAPELSVQGH
jgi:hypothetical protein